MEPSPVISYFTNETFEQFMASTRTHLGYRQRRNWPSGTVVILVNKEKESVLGVCRLADWDDSKSPCREKHYLDPDVYGGADKIYNKYEFKIEGLRILKNPVTFDEIKFLVGGHGHEGKTNMWKNTHLSYVRVFIKGDDQSPLKRYMVWVKSLL